MDWDSYPSTSSTCDFVSFSGEKRMARAPNAFWWLISLLGPFHPLSRVHPGGNRAISITRTFHPGRNIAPRAISITSTFHPGRNIAPRAISTTRTFDPGRNIAARAISANRTFHPGRNIAARAISITRTFHPGRNIATRVVLKSFAFHSGLSTKGVVALMTHSLTSVYWMPVKLSWYGLFAE